MTSKMMTITPASELIQDVGDGFRPKEKELVNHYLKLKILGFDNRVSRIPELDIYKHEPWDLPHHSLLNSNCEEWYFFHRCRSGRPSRTTKAGYWKVTCRKRKIKDDEKEIGIKNICVFHIGRARNGQRTKWIMHEYSADFNLPNQRAFVLCKLFQKKSNNKRTMPPNDDESSMPASDEGDLCHNMAASNLGNQNSNQKTDNSIFNFEGETSQFVMTCENQEITEQVDVDPLPYMGSFYGNNEQSCSLNFVLDSHTNIEQDLSYDDDLWDFSTDTQTSFPNGSC